MSDSDLGTPSDTSVQPGLAWGNAIKELYTKIPAEPERIANWPTNFVFMIPCEIPESQDVEKVNGILQRNLLQNVLNSALSGGYRLGYATQALFNLPVHPDKDLQEKLKAAFVKDEGIRKFLLLFDYVHRTMGAEPDEKARTLCQQVYARFFHEGFGDDNMDQHGEKMKETLDKMWKKPDFEWPTAKIHGHGPNKETYFHLGMKEAAKDFEDGWEKLTDTDWDRRYKGLAWYKQGPKKVPQDSPDQATDKQEPE